MRQIFTGPLLAASIGSILCAAQTRADEPRLSDIVITASRDKNPLEVAQPTAVLSGDDLARQTAGSLGETLSRQLGVSSSYFGPTASRPVIRGLGGYRVQTLQDGIATLDVSGLSDDHAVTVDPALAQQLEVLKGPATLLYGSGASGGLINVVTHRIPDSSPESGFEAMTELRAATVDDERSGAMAFGAGNDTFALHGDYFKSKTDAIDIPGTMMSARLRDELIAAGQAPEDSVGIVSNAFGDSQGGALGASWLSDMGSVGGSASRYETTYGIPSEATAFIDLKQTRYDVKGDWNLDGDWLRRVRLSGAYNDYTHTEFEGPGIPGTRFDQQAYEARVSLDHKHTDTWRGTFGAQLTHIDFVAEGDEAFVPPSVTKSFGAFALEEFEVGEWTVNVGGRAERQTIDVSQRLPNFADTALSAAAGTVWKFTDVDSLAINVTRTSRHPQATELYADGPHIASGRFELGDASLDTETATTVDVSMRRSSDVLSWSFNLFYNDYDNFIFADPTGDFVDDLVEVQYRQTGAKLYGYEAEFWLPLHESTAGGTWRLRLLSDAVRGEKDNGEPLPQIPPQRFGAGLHFDRAAWHAELEAIRAMEQDRLSPNELPTKGYTMVNADLSYRFSDREGDWLLFVRGTNLLDEEARQHASALKDLVPLPGRSLKAGVRVQF